MPQRWHRLTVLVVLVYKFNTYIQCKSDKCFNMCELSEFLPKHTIPYKQLVMNIHLKINEYEMGK